MDKRNKAHYTPTLWSLWASRLERKGNKVTSPRVLQLFRLDMLTAQTRTLMVEIENRGKTLETFGWQS